MTHITDYGGAIDDYYPARIERIADMELTELEKRADIEAEKSRMKPEVLDGGWQSVELKPAHWKDVLLLCQDGMCVAFWDGEEWVSDLRGKGNNQWIIGPMFWRNLPEPPK